jgi:hypothetical protein
MGIFRSTDPTVFDDVDGIIVNESAPTPNVQGVAANVAILIAQMQRGGAALTEVGSIGEFHELYGKSLTHGANIALKNKKFGRLKVARVIAADGVAASKAFAYAAVTRLTFAAKQGKGSYGNNIQVKIEEGSSSLKPVWDIACVADVAASLDGLYFVLQEKAGTIGFWIDVDNGGGSAPAGAAACTRSVEITTITTGMTAAQVAGVLATKIAAETSLSAVVANTTHVTVSSDEYSSSALASAGDSGFTLTETVAGVTGKKYTIHDSNTYAVLPDEVYDDIQIEDITSATFADSVLVDVTVNSSAFEPTNAAFTNLASGAEGTVVNSEYETAIALCEVENAGNFIFLDEYNATRNGYLKAHSAATMDKMVIMAGAEGDSVSTAVTDVASYRDASGRNIYAYPWIQTSLDGTSDYVSPASWVASVLSQTSPHIDPAYTKNSQFLGGITGLKTALTRSNYISLKNAGIMAFEYDSDIGYKIKSGIVTQIVDSALVTVLRRRMADYLTSSVAAYLKNFQNAVNSAANRTLVKGSILGFIQQQESFGILPKDSDVSSGVAKLVDTESLNTDASIAAGFFRILWRQRIYSSMRYIVLQAEICESVTVTET